MRVADYIMQRLANLGIKQVFFLPGGGAMHLNDALGLNPDLAPILCLHEQACGIAAEAAGKLLAAPSACLVTSGPGATNVVTPTLGAWLDSTPVFFISGQVKTADLKTGSGLRMLGVQEVDIVSIVQTITKKAVTLLNPEDVAYVFDELEEAALTGRKGPVWLDVPLDIQAMEVDPSSLRRMSNKKQQIRPSLQNAIKETLELIAKAKRPVIIAGNGIRIAGAEKNFRDFFERTGIPVLTTWLGMDLIEEDHPLHGGRPGSIAPRWANFALQNADLLLVIGARLDMAMTAYAHERFAPGAIKIMVDIDEAEIKKMQTEIALPIVSDAKYYLEQINNTIETNHPNFSFESWKNQIEEWKKAYPLIRPEHITSEGPISLYHFSDALSSELEEGDIIAPGSSGFSSEIFLLALRLKKNQRCFHNRGTGSMGFGLPAAIGACLASGRRRTICIEGDGGFQLNSQELATLAKQNIPVKLFVINNGGYASIKTSQNANFQRLIGADPESGLFLPDLKKIADAYGLPYVTIESGKNLKNQLNSIISGNNPIVCEVIAIPDEPRIPRIMTRQGENGKIESSPLEDLFPFLDRDELMRNMISR